jgi:hypothetical protein
MLSKKLFVEIINNIQEQDKVDNAFGKSLETVCDSWCIYGTKNKIYNSVWILLKEIFNDTDDWISWWVYEDVKKEITYKNGKIILLDTSEKLYDFLIKNMKEKHA